MLVTCSEAFWRTRFQTLMTSPQVVSTIWHPRALIASTGRELRTEGGDDYDILGAKFLDIGIARMRCKVPDAHGGKLSVYFRVVNDLAQ